MSKLSGNDWCKIRVWNTQSRGESVTIKEAVGRGRSDPDSVMCIGHASCETHCVTSDGEQTLYASHWPAESANSKFEVCPQANLKLEQDLHAEGRPPDTEVTLYSLDVKRMNAAINELWEQEPGWTLTGEAVARGAVGVSTGLSWASSVSSSFGRMLGNLIIIRQADGKRSLKAQSCVSAVMLFLMAGRIDERLDKGYSRAMKLSVKTPNIFAEYVREMKRVELDRYPETKDFAGSEMGEAPPPKDKCAIL